MMLESVLIGVVCAAIWSLPAIGLVSVAVWGRAMWRDE